MTVKELTNILLDSADVRFFNERDELLFEGPLYRVAQDGYFFLDEKEVLYVEARYDDYYLCAYLAIALDTRENEENER